MSKPRVVAFGELLLRLKAPGHERLFQSALLEATFGGAEANTAASLAQFGIPSAYVTALPQGSVGDAAIAELRRFGLDTSRVVRTGDRVGIYFLEAGAAQRPSRVVYDRAGSAIATARPGTFHWDSALDGAEWLHLSGITPAISASAADLCLEAARTARDRGISVSCDLNFRANLWRYGRSAPEVMRELMRYVNVCVAGREDCASALGIAIGSDGADDQIDLDRFRELAERVLAEFPNLDRLVVTLRESHSASHNGWSACMHDRERFLVSRKFQITGIVDRVGAGDAFSAGLIYGLLQGGDAQWALDFATAASCLKHTIPGDINRVTVSEVEALVQGHASGRVQR